MKNTIKLKDGQRYALSEITWDGNIKLATLFNSALFLTPKEYSEQWEAGVLDPLGNPFDRLTSF